MSQTSTSNYPGQLSYVYGLYKTLKTKNFILSFEGGFSQNLTKNILTLTENKLNSIGEEESVKKKVFNVMVECLQNICKYADEAERPDEYNNHGIFMIGKDELGYFLVSGNFVNNDQINQLTAKINAVNSLDKDGLKDLYKSTLQESVLHDKGGANLGLIDIARKSGQKLDYNFDKIDDKCAFYTLKTRVNKPMLI